MWKTGKTDFVFACFTTRSQDEDIYRGHVLEISFLSSVCYNGIRSGDRPVWGLLPDLFLLHMSAKTCINGQLKCFKLLLGYTSD